jgi:hypothetical protein
MRTIPAGQPPVFGALAAAVDVAAGVALALGIALATGVPEPPGAGSLLGALVTGGGVVAGTSVPTGGLEGPAGGASTVAPQALTEAMRYAVASVKSAAPIAPA